MIEKVKNDPYWSSEITNIEEKLLEKGQPYVLCPGTSPTKIVLYYLNQTKKIEQSEITLEDSSKKWIYKNGTNMRKENYNEIIKYILNI